MWFTRFLFILTMATAFTLGVMVIAAPWSDQLPVENHIIQKMLHLVAEDKIVRRTTIVCSIGLLATAWIFFRSHGPLEEEEPDAETELEFIEMEPEPEKHRKPPPGSVAGA